MKRVYLDNAATTPTDPAVVKAMLPYFTKKFGNASSIHQFGREARNALEDSRELIAKKLNATPSEIIFTSGGTESNNFALKGIAFANRDKGNHIITSAIEHDCVLHACKWLEKQGFSVTYLPVDNYGLVNPEQLDAAITDKTLLVSVMHGNNEVGTIEPIAELGRICREHNVYFHTDACQSFTKAELDVKEQNLNLVTINAHKLHGPKGVGALYIRGGTKIEAWQHGGGHEKNMRSGTENIAGIVGFAKAAELATPKDVKRMAQLRDTIINGVLKMKGTELNGHPTQRLCSNANLSFKGIEGESLLLRLDARGIACSTGSACSSHSLEASHVLKAMGMGPEVAHSSIRFSLGKQNTKQEIKYVLDAIEDDVKQLRKMSPFGD